MQNVLHTYYADTAMPRRPPPPKRPPPFVAPYATRSARYLCVACAVYSFCFRAAIWIVYETSAMLFRHKIKCPHNNDIRWRIQVYSLRWKRSVPPAAWVYLYDKGNALHQFVCSMSTRTRSDSQIRDCQSPSLQTSAGIVAVCVCAFFFLRHQLG